MGEIERLPGVSNADIVKALGGEPQPGCDVTFTQQMGEGRVLQLKTTFFQGVPLDAQKRIVREFLSIADEERKRYEIVEMEARLIGHRQELANAHDLLAVADTHLAKRGAEIEVEMRALDLEKSGSLETFERDFRVSGRGGKFQAAGSQKRVIEGIDQQIGSLKAEAAKIVSERETRKGELSEAITLRTVAIGKLERDIEISKAALGMG